MFRCPKRRENKAFRARIQDTASAFRLEIEGRFAAADASEVEARWRAGISTLGSRPLEVDLTRVTWMAPQARALLQRIDQEGAKLLLPPGGEQPPSAQRGWGSLAVVLECFASRLRSALGFASG